MARSWSKRVAGWIALAASGFGAGMFASDSPAPAPDQPQARGLEPEQPRRDRPEHDQPHEPATALECELAAEESRRCRESSRLAIDVWSAAALACGVEPPRGPAPPSQRTEHATIMSQPEHEPEQPRNPPHSNGHPTQ